MGNKIRFMFGFYIKLLLKDYYFGYNNIHDAISKYVP